MQKMNKLMVWLRSGHHLEISTVHTIEELCAMAQAQKYLVFAPSVMIASDLIGLIVPAAEPLMEGESIPPGVTKQ